MANCSVPPFFGCCAPTCEAVLPKATAAAPVIKTERLVKVEFIVSLPDSFSRRPASAQSDFMAGHEMARTQRPEYWNFPPALLAGDRTAGMEDAAARRGQG